MELAEFVALENKVLAIAFALSVIFGAIARRTGFCTMGAVSDVYNMGSWTRMRVWGMAAGVAMIGFAVMSYLGWIRPLDTIYSAGRMNWLPAVVGGLLFGFGMVLASGCAHKTLVRIGEGNLKSLVVFVMMAIGAISAMWGFASALHVLTTNYGSFYIESGNLTPAWIASAFGWDASNIGLVMAIVIGGGLAAWAMSSAKFRASGDNLLAGLGIGLLIVAMWWVLGHMGYVAEHPDTLDSFYAGTASGSLQSFSFTSPIGRTLHLVMMTDLNQQIVLKVGVVTVLGVILGSFLHAILTRSFQWEGLYGEQDTALHIIGGLCMGVGGVVAGGCTVGQGVSGVSTLSGVSFIAVMGIMLGAIVGLRLQMWLLMRDE
ncbi:YeeE/YedE family protein [Ovoidimarina sediminis]|uniref:YeeE/YedE family protein n=1 Tax=Ovoidimarina sediminis TaxID=3079856 RepID=UPI00290C31EF|nr:YeeE/YedE family protein [Rhodophyticola sp. MJ-SS7]MDU8946725.1 YeeE/YedE family protein [Rhodophyticola sp. MJ-SS7]